jgi:YegS/Rv2252/BmrU family lipid kinase
MVGPEQLGLPVARHAVQRESDIYDIGNKQRQIGEEKGKSADTVLVVNPTSGGGSTGRGWQELYNQLRETLGKGPKVAFTEKPGDGTTLTRYFLKKGVKQVIAVGGDGTINEVANGFFIVDKKGSPGKRSPFIKPINPEATMGLLPRGTRNVLARSLDYPAEVTECCRNLVTGEPHRIDVISTTATDPSNSGSSVSKVFLNAAEIGFGAEIIERSKMVRSKVNSRLMSTAAGIVSTMPMYESNLCEIVIDNGRDKLLTKMTMGVIANGKYLGGGFQAAPKASVSDGLLDIVILKDSGSFKMLDELMHVKSGNYSNEGNIFYLQAKNVSIISKERDVAVVVDGEPLGVLPATFLVIKNALNLSM